MNAQEALEAMKEGKVVTWADYPIKMNRLRWSERGVGIDVLSRSTGKPIMWMDEETFLDEFQDDAFVECQP